LSPDKKEYHLLQNKAKDLSDLFASKEGRRPRILIGGAHGAVLKNSNVLGTTFADLGCNVDIAPLHSDFGQLAKQSIENDVDIVLMLAPVSVEKRELEKFKDIVLKQQPDIILSLYHDDSKHLTAVETRINQWIIFDQSTNSIVLASKLISHLLQIPG